MSVLISLIVILVRIVIISQCICISNHHILRLTYMQILFVNYTSTKLKKQEDDVGNARKYHGFIPFTVSTLVSK